MNFFEEMQWRGMIHDYTPEIEAYLNEKNRIGYIGFDPTAPSLTIGNYVQIMILKLFQRAGHTPIVLMGGATGRIGDPSGKDAERQLKSYEELDRNLEFQKKQVEKFLNEGEENKAIIVNNLDFYDNMNVLDFLRKVGKVLTVNYMLSKESVKKRLESGLSFTEFSYQLLQAYDFQCLYEKYNCSIQMGGSDQWGNITSGTEFVRRNLKDAKAFALTTPLLTKADGSKFGKSEKGNLWLSAELTSPYQFYQFWINTADADLPKFLKYFSLKERSEMQELLNQIDENPNEVKRILAEELTERVHGSDALESAQKASQFLFNRSAKKEDVHNLQIQELEIIASEIPVFTIQETPTNIVDLLTQDTEILKSKGEARRALKGNAIAINKVKIQDPEHSLSSDDFLHDKYLLVDNGKKNKFMVIKNS